MATDNYTYWQVAAGSMGRDYTQDFLRYGMAFVGGPIQIATIAQVKANDRIILKRGMTEIAAVGKAGSSWNRVGKNGLFRSLGDAPNSGSSAHGAVWEDK